MAELEQSAANRLGRRLAVISAVTQLREPRDHRCKIVRIAALEIIQELLHRDPSRCRLVKLYRKFHNATTSILMYNIEAQYRRPARLFYEFKVCNLNAAATPHRHKSDKNLNRQGIVISLPGPLVVAICRHGMEQHNGCEANTPNIVDWLDKLPPRCAVYATILRASPRLWSGMIWSARSASSA